MENNANNHNNKPHLLYMTGLSIDKNRMNNITENINFDKDFSYWLKNTQIEFNSVFNPNNQKLGESIELTNKLLKKQIDNILDLKDIINIFDNKLIEETSDKIIKTGVDKIRKKVENFLKPMASKVFDIIGYKDKDKIYEEDIKILLNDLVKKYHNTLPI